MISHDLSVVEHVSDKVAVMYFGRVVEEGDWHSIFSRPTHPYTRRLIGSVPDPDAILSGARTLPDAASAFHPTYRAARSLTKNPSQASLSRSAPATASASYSRDRQ